MVIHWLLLIFSGLLLAVSMVLMRAGSRRGATTWGLSLFVGLAACAVAAPFAWRHLALFSWGYGGLMLAAGALAIGGIWACVEATSRGPVGPTLMIRNYSMIVPLAGSALFYGESFGWWQAVGTALVLASVPLFQSRRKSGPISAGEVRPDARWLAYCAAMFVLFGVADFLFRDGVHRAASSDAFLLGVVLLGFAGNVLGSVVGLAASRQRPNRHDVLWGSAVGLMNVTLFTIALFIIRDMGGVLVFPARLIISVVAVVLLAAALFGERPGGRAVAGLALGTVGIVLIGWGG